jgi:hypothetical protein
MIHFNKLTKLKIEQKIVARYANPQHQRENVDETVSEIKMQLLFDKVKLTDIAEALNMKTLISAKRWCKRKGLVIIKFGKEQYVNLIDFQLQLDKPILDDLRAKHPNDWAEMYHSYKTFDWSKIVGQILSPRLKAKFTVEGHAANDFMNKMKSHG